MKALRVINYTKCTFLSELQKGITLLILILQALYFLLYMHCIMVQVWCKFYKNTTKGIEVIVQNLIC